MQMSTMIYTQDTASRNVCIDEQSVSIMLTSLGMYALHPPGMKCGVTGHEGNLSVKRLVKSTFLLHVTLVEKQILIGTGVEVNKCRKYKVRDLHWSISRK